MARTLYDVLGVPRGASSVEIDAAFRERMAEFKGKSYAGADSFDDIREAFRVLSNLNSRSGYDQTLPSLRSNAKEESGGMPGWIKWALPFVIVAGVLVWMKMKAPREPVMTVTSVKRIENPDYDPTRPAPVVIGPAVPDTPDPPSGTKGPARAGNAEDIFASAAPSIARVLVKDAGGRPVSQGSGVVIGSGTIVTNCHVTQNASEISVKVGSEEYSASVSKEDKEHDLCHLAVSGLSAPSVSIGSVAGLRTGQRVFAIGAPQGLELTISEGIVSALRAFPDGTVIQTSAPISPGSSGGGLFDASGRLVGIVTFQHKFGQNLNFAVPADWIHK